jgi:hypothetical protein
MGILAAAKPFWQIRNAVFRPAKAYLENQTVPDWRSKNVRLAQQ